MKVKLVCHQNEYKTIKKQLEAGGFTIDEDSQYVFYDQSSEVDHIMGKVDDEYEVIPVSQIVLIESYSHDIVLHTMEGQYLIKEKLYQIEGMLEKKGFIRVNQSTVINRHFIKRIKPALNSKFTLKMKNKVKVDVTRSYYHKFKALMNI